jgi:hypothetical protein
MAFSSHFLAVACASAFSMTPLRPPSNCRNTGTEAWYIEIGIERSSFILDDINAAPILTSTDLTVKGQLRRAVGATSRFPFSGEAGGG